MPRLAKLSSKPSHPRQRMGVDCGARNILLGTMRRHTHAEGRRCADNVSVGRYAPHKLYHGGVAPSAMSTLTCRAAPEEASSSEDAMGAAQQEQEASTSASKEETQLPTKDVYVKPQMSKEQREKLRQEYLGLGGSASSAMSTNWFLNICVGISVLAVLTKLTGALG